MPDAPNCFAGGEIDRVSHLRGDEAWLAAQLKLPSNRLTPVWRSASWVAAGEPRRAGLVSLEIGAQLLETSPVVVLLGRAGEIAYFAVDLSPAEDPSSVPPLRGQGEFIDLRQVAPLLNQGDGALLAYARAMITWHRRHRFCGLCGTPTRVGQAGHVRLCENRDCATEHFPRTDPAVIMLVTDGKRCLLGRQASWPPRVYSALAGFVEPGESLEEAVAREVAEETGIVVREVRYQSSQPWPFPLSIMLGFRAEAGGGCLRVDPEELEDARWFTPRELTDLCRTREVRLPPRLSIARRLIDAWLESPGVSPGV